MKKFKFFILTALTSLFFLFSCGESVPSNPDEYMQKIINSEIQKTTSKLATQQSLLLKSQILDNYEINSLLKVQIEDACWNLVNTVLTIADIDLKEINTSSLPSIDSFALSGTTKYQNENIGLNLNLAMNDTDIVHANILSFTESSESYVQLPEFIESFVKIPISLKTILDETDFEYSSLKNNYNLSSKLLSLNYKTFIDGLFSSVISQITNVEKSETEVSAGNNNIITKKYTLLTATLSEEILENMANAVEQYCNTSKELDAIINELVSIANEISNEQISAIELKDNLIYTLTSLFNSPVLISAQLKVYADVMKSQGFSIKLYDDYTNREFSYLTISDKNNFATNISLSEDDEQILISGDSKITGSKSSGEYFVSFEKQNLGSIKLIDVETSDNKLSYSGKTVISLSNGLFKLLDLDLDKSISSMLKSFSYIIEGKLNDKEVNLSVSLADKELSPYFSIILGAKINTKTTPMSVPTEYIDSNDERLYEELSDISFEKILANIDKTSIASEYKVLIRMLAEYAEEYVQDNLY